MWIFDISRIAVCMLAVGTAGQALAQSMEERFAGKQIKLLIGSSAGGGYDLFARTIAPHWSKHMPGQPTFLPQNMSLFGYEQIFADDRIWTGYRNTVVYTVVGTALNMVVTMPAAFALSRREFRPRRVLMLFFAFTMFFSGGQAVHYSSDFAARGYSGASHGCVNVRDYDALASLFDQVAVGDKVVVYRS